MVISFIGHSDIYGDVELESRLSRAINDLFLSCAEPIEFYCGGYGAFDRLCEHCLIELRKKYARQYKIYLISPYADIAHCKNLSAEAKNFDGIIYPGIEKTPLKYAILQRNKWMIDSSDIVVAYIKKTWGGAYKTYKYAASKHKKIILL